MLELGDNCNKNVSWGGGGGKSSVSWSMYGDALVEPYNDICDHKTDNLPPQKSSSHLSKSFQRHKIRRQPIGGDDS